MLMTFTANQTVLAANTPQEFAVATYVSTQQAIDSLEILAPLANLDQDWHYWTARSTFREDTEPSDKTQWEVDIRSMRKLRHGYGFVLVAEPVLANTASIEMTVGARLLWSVSN